MHNQQQLGTVRGIASSEAVALTRKLISDLTRNLENLETDQAALDQRRNVHFLSGADHLARMLEMRRRNLKVTIGALVDRLVSIEQLRSRIRAVVRRKLAI